MIADPVAVTAPAKPPGRPFLPAFDGMRGFFGIYICIAHVYVRLVLINAKLFPLPAHFVAIGHNAVGMFIVISGYVLGLPVARAGQTFRGGLRKFAARRARRILPAYYAALLIAIPIILLIAPGYHEALPPHRFEMAALLHALMLHNFSNSAITAIDGPMWSIAIECDAYVLFPLVMVPLARRFGFRVMVGTIFAISLLPTLLGALRHNYVDYHLAQTCPWFIGLFALGYAAASLTVDPRPAVVRAFTNWPWSKLAAVFAVATAIAVALTPSSIDLDKGGNGIRWYADILIGLAIACQFTADSQARLHGRRTLFERFFTLRPLLFLGTFSYSFYLLHIPISDLVMRVAQPDWTRAQIGGLAVVSLIVALAVSYVFYRLVERPFMSEYRRRGDAASLRSSVITEIPDDADATATPRSHVAPA